MKWAQNWAPLNLHWARAQDHWKLERERRSKFHDWTRARVQPILLSAINPWLLFRIILQSRLFGIFFITLNLKCFINHLIIQDRIKSSLILIDSFPFFVHYVTNWPSLCLDKKKTVASFIYFIKKQRFFINSFDCTSYF